MTTPKLETTTIPVPEGPIDLDQEMQKHLESAREAVELDVLDCAVCCAYTEVLVYVLAVPYADYEEKAKTKKALRKFINSRRIRAAIFISEAWLRDVKDFDKIVGEAICVAGRDACHYRVATQKLVKNLDGSIIFEPVHISDVDESRSPNAWFNGCRFVA